MPEKLEGLQAARAIAAGVAYFHSYIALRAFPESAQIPIGPLKEWGYFGVNFFFSISVYVICLIASKPTFSPWPFAIKRVFRLYPMYWLALAVVAGLIAIGKYRPEPLGHFLYSMTLLPQPGAPAYDVSWTLEREIVFYVLAAIIVPLGGCKALPVVLESLGFAGLNFGNPWTFHLVSTTHFDFLAGVVAFLIQDRTKRVGAIAPIVAGIASDLHPDTRLSCIGVRGIGTHSARNDKATPALAGSPSSLDRSGRRCFVLNLFAAHSGFHGDGLSRSAPRPSGMVMRALALRNPAVVLHHLLQDLACDRGADDRVRQPAG